VKCHSAGEFWKALQFDTSGCVNASDTMTVQPLAKKITALRLRVFSMCVPTDKLVDLGLCKTRPNAILIIETNRSEVSLKIPLCFIRSMIQTSARRYEI